MFDFPEFLIPLGDWINIAVEWLTINLEPLFDAITVGIREPLVKLEHLLWWLPWWRCGERGLRVRKKPRRRGAVHARLRR